MLPVALNIVHLPVLLAGQGALVEKRLAMLDEAGATQVAVFCAAPSEALKLAAGSRLIERLPEAQELSHYAVIFVAGLPLAQSQQLTRWAREAGKLVNAEDIRELCDFYCMSILRRGDLVLGVSTSGASPTLARRVRDWLAQRFGAQWSGYLEEMKQLRQGWREEGASFEQVIKRSEQHVDAAGWLPEREDAA